MTETIDLAALMNAARDRSPAGRTRLFSLLGQLFLARGSGLSESERRGFAELLAILLPVTDAEARLELAYATAESTDAPAELALLLAEDEIEIAALVLFRAATLGAAELLRLAEKDERAQIIAGRRALPMMVADALMRRGDPELARTLLKNDAIKLSIPALDATMDLAHNDADLQQRLAARPELLEEMAKDMLEWAEAPVREHLIERFELSPAAGLQARLKALASLGLEGGMPLERDFAALAGESTAPEPSTQPPARFRVTPRLMAETLRRDELARAEMMFAVMADLPAPLIRRFAKENDGERIATAARGIGMAREEFATIYLLWKKARSNDGLVAAGELGKAIDLFDQLPQDRVEVTIADWRREAAEATTAA